MHIVGILYASACAKSRIGLLCGVYHSITDIKIKLYFPHSCNGVLPPQQRH